MSPVVTFGEIMMRLSAPCHQRFAQATHFEIAFGGAEANAAVIIAQLGGEAHFVTRLPKGPLGDRALSELAARNVGTDHIARGGNRLGIYFVEQGASQRSSQVLYDRAQSAFAEAEDGDFHWQRILADTAWFHWSGITPSLSNRAPKIVAEASAHARAAGCKISFDMNYRAKLWTAESAGKILEPLVRDLDLCICGVEEARTVFRLEGASPSDIARQLTEQLGARCVAIPRREAATAGRTLWSAALFIEGSEYQSRTYELEIVDRIGAGDAFTGALLFAMMRGGAPGEIVEFAAAAGALKHTVPGDFALVSLAEVEALAAGADGGRVRR
ncbi:MAG TPA: sugar kinase [Chthoniobacteraceae bacterium]|nr:sugar kinase [Chthoniobacteraceae bacterium]